MTLEVINPKDHLWEEAFPDDSERGIAREFINRISLLDGVKGVSLVEIDICNGVHGMQTRRERTLVVLRDKGEMKDFPYWCEVDDVLSEVGEQAKTGGKFPYNLEVLTDEESSTFLRALPRAHGVPKLTGLWTKHDSAIPAFSSQAISAP